MALPAKTMQATVGADRTPYGRTCHTNKNQTHPSKIVPQKQLWWGILSKEARTDFSAAHSHL